MVDITDDKFLHPSVRGMTEEEQLEALDRISISNPDHLKEWLAKTGRQFVVFKSDDLVDALPWPFGVGAFMEIVAAYRDHRAVQETGRFEDQIDPRTGKTVRLSIYKGECLEIEELDRCIRYLIGQASTTDPKWSLDNDPM